MRVTTTELRVATLALLDHLEATGQTEFEIDEDYYWSVPQTLAYDPTETPASGELTLGQLSHDRDEVLALVDGSKPPFSYALVWLSAILRRVGEQASG